MIQSRSLGSKIFDVSNHVVLLFFALATVLPFVNVMACSFASSQEVLKHRFLLFPTDFSLDAFRYIFSTGTIMRAMSVSLYITILGTLINLILTVLTAYPLAHSNLRGRKYVMHLIVFTMLFSGGMIPTFLVVKSVGLINSLWALMIPNAINAFNLVVLKNFMQQVPMELEESAKIDGCNYFVILVRIILPLSLPAIATFALFYAVGHWNAYFHAILYINDSGKWPIQVLLRQIVLMAAGGVGDSSQFSSVLIPPQTVKVATITLSTLPILFVYPFLQKHFTKGIMLGSVKG